MVKARFILTQRDPALVELISRTDHRTLGVWAGDCAERVLRYFAAAFPNDDRPQQAIAALRRWVDTGEFSMAVIRAASLGSHAAAREVGEDNPARSAARAAGQAVATAHVATHAIGPAMYALQAVDRATGGDADAIEAERRWQCEHLLAPSRSLYQSV